LTSTLVSLSLPALMFVIACLVKDISSIEDAVAALLFLLALSVLLFLSYLLLGALQLKRENRSAKLSVWYSAGFSVFITVLLVCFSFFIGLKSTQLVVVATIVFLLSWLVHLTGSLAQYIQMTSHLQN